MEADTIPFRFVLEEVDKVIIAATAGTTKCGWRHVVVMDQTAHHGSWEK